MAYADKIKLDHLQEKQKEIFRTELEEAEKDQERKKSRRKEQEQVKQPDPIRWICQWTKRTSPVDLAPNENVEPQSDVMANRQSILTDEDIMKWDPDNFDTIKRIMAENEQPSKFEEDEETDL